MTDEEQVVLKRARELCALWKRESAAGLASQAGRDAASGKDTPTHFMVAKARLGLRLAVKAYEKAAGL